MKKIVESFICRFLRDESGQAVVIVSVFMGLIALGFMAFAVDTGMLFREKRMVQSAAQAAALAAAEQAGSGQSASQQLAVAQAMAKLNGFDTTLATNPATVTLTTPSNGNFTGSSYVQATVSMPIHTFFLGAFSKALANVPVTATAIAGGGGVSSTCVCVSGNFTVSGGSTLDASGCGIYVNSAATGSISVSGGSTIKADSLAGDSTGWDVPPPPYPPSSSIFANGDTISVPTIVQGLTSTCSTTLPPVPAYDPSTCIANPYTGWTSKTSPYACKSGVCTFGPSTPGGTVCYNALTVGAGGTTDTLTAGIYVISGGVLNFSSNRNLGGDGVFFYLTNGASLVMNGGSGVNLVAGGSAESNGSTAPSVGPNGVYNGILMYQDQSDTTAMSITGGSNPYINGSIIAPTASLTIDGGSSSGGMQGGFDVQNLTVSGGSVGATVGTSMGSLSTPSAAPTLVQ